MKKILIGVAILFGLTACSKDAPAPAPEVSAQDQADLKKVLGPDKPLELKPVGSKDATTTSAPKGEEESKP